MTRFAVFTRWWFILAGLTLFVLVCVVLAYRSLGQQTLNELAERSENRLTLFVSNLEGTLAKYENMPRLISGERLLISALERERSASVDDTNRYLKNVAAIIGASDVYLMTRDGTTIASSNWDMPHSFVGRNFAFRPYYQHAVEGRAGRYFALGTTSLKRGYYFSYPVTRSQDVIGVVAIKIDLADIERAWTDQGNHFLVTDGDGIVFLSTQPEWTYRSLEPLGAGQLEEIRESQRYFDRSIEPLGLEQLGDSTDAFRLVSLPEVAGEPARAYLHLARSMPAAGWEVHLFANVSQARASQLLRTAVAGFALLVLMLLIGLYLANRQRRMALQQSADLLESRVRQRTGELQIEIEERRKAEQSLRDAQSELIHAAKMAGLGQMSAGISHELNQPLTAIRNYARNAQRLLDANREADACRNLGEIEEITRHMAGIIGQLRGFSRKSVGEIQLVSIRESVAQALDLFQRDFDSAAIEKRIEVDADLAIRTDPLLLNQVLVNVIGNAIQAMDASPVKRLTIKTAPAEEMLEIQVIDTGSGIDDTVIANIFDPFFTTKEVGMGLGLGLSISYRIMETLGGRIEAANNPAGGARFSLYLPDER